MKRLLLLLPLVGCGMDHDVKGGTNNKMEIVISIQTCEDERFTPEEKLECVREFNNIDVGGEVKVTQPEIPASLTTK